MCEDDKILEPESSECDERITYVKEHRTYLHVNILSHTAYKVIMHEEINLGSQSGGGGWP